MNKSKIKTKQDLIDFIAALPNGWRPTKCMAWSCPELIRVGQGFEECEVSQYIEIRLDGPATDWRDLFALEA